MRKIMFIFIGTLIISASILGASSTKQADIAPGEPNGSAYII